MKTASKVFIIFSLVGAVLTLVAGVASGIWFFTIFTIWSIIIWIVGFNALSRLEKARKHDDLVAIGVLTMIFCSFLGGLFMLLIKDEDLKVKKYYTPALTPSTTNCVETSESQEHYIEEKGSLSVTCCARCGGELVDGQNFCGKCGMAVENCNICPNCNNINKIQDTFCRNCGHKLKEQ